MSKILLIEDDLDVFELLRHNLSRAGFHFVGANRGKDAVEICLRERPDLILLDIMLPDASGLALLTRVRSQAVLAGVPIIFVTALANDTDRITGLEPGANDYIVKPFSIREVIARINAHLRMSLVASSYIIRYGAIELDRNRCQVRHKGKLVTLTATEFRLLDFLMSRPSIVFSREQLRNAVWRTSVSTGHPIVDVYMFRIRKKLEAGSANPRLISSVRGFGYYFNPEAAADKSELVAAHA